MAQHVDLEPGAYDAGKQAAACAARRQAFGTRLAQLGLAGAMLCRPVHLAYFFGLWGWRSMPSAGLVTADGAGIVSLGASADCIVHADEIIRFEDARHATLIDDREAAAIAGLRPRVDGIDRMGSDLPVAETGPAVTAAITAMRRRKDAAEIDLLLAAIRATEAGYRAVVPVIGPGLLETELFAIFQRATIIAAGQALGELGNDFRGGAPGGRPRAVPLVAGDLVPLDAGVVLYNYNADLCRTLAVSGTRTRAQDQAFRRVAEALEEAEARIAADVSCRAVFEAVAARLNTDGACRFDHHLGHGIGLCAHEAPRLNPFWDDRFEDGDVFTLEPGLYGEGLRAGIRLEQNYLIREGKLHRLSSLPLDLQAVA